MAIREVTRHLAREVRKSHLGNPEMGRILPNMPHVRIFLLRLMRLLYHQIKPVFVFDGVMPVAKRREIRHRRDQREKNEEDGGKEGPLGVGRGGALKRATKKILVKQLKEWRENESMIQKKKTQKKKEDDKSGESDTSMDDMARLESKFKVGTSKMPRGSGAFAAGSCSKRQRFNFPITATAYASDEA
jgi:hypothetical protein